MTDANRRRITSLSWALAALVAVVLWLRVSPDRGALPAIAEIGRHTVSARSPGRVEAVFVRAGQSVRSGDPVAQLDAVEIDELIAGVHASIDEHLAALEAVTAELQGEVRLKRQSLGAELARARISLAAARGEQAAAQAEMSTLDEQIGRLDRVVRDRLIEADRVGELKARHESLTRTTAHAPAVLSAWQSLASEVNTTLNAISDAEVAARLSPYRARLEATIDRLANLLVARERLTLRAPVDGQVSEVLRLRGDTVVAGAGVLVLSALHPRQIIAYAPEESARAFEPGRLVSAIARDRSLKTDGRVRTVGAEIIELPRHLWTVPDRPRYGRPVYIDVDRPEDLIAGEVLAIRVDVRSGAQASMVAEPAPPAVAVPQVLRETSSLEPSGMVYIEAWKRFVVVSDDTGTEKADGRPIAFTLDPEKGYDASPVPILGLDEVSDLEAITSGPSGTVFLLCSQSMSRKGRRPEKRQWLAHAEIQNDPWALKVTSKMALFDRVAERLDAQKRAELGWTDLLDIEGMFHHDGALYFGLKAPLDAADRARILRFPDALVALKTGVAHIEPVVSVSLPTCAVGAAGGLSDLYLDGDAVYATSSLSVGPACGTAWRLSLSSVLRGEVVPTRLRSFEGYKPEGIARDPSGRLWVSFDTDRSEPRLTLITETKP
ncbi:MAG: biotin/lipoyl-binding protein [Myxococcales bacterium]|nr:biotin/lipoyl-binding protein [Myxococcales bacterium]